MLTTCEEYAASHNLKFSTDTDPVKCKTKLMAFLKKPRELPSLMLCGNPLPWVSQIKHLGNTISNSIDGNQLDIRVKTAKFIDKNNSINQEFYFANPDTKMKLNNIFNGHFTGSPLWKLGSKELAKLESAYNKSVKIMYDLPWATHRYLIEPVSGFPHLSRILVGRYLSFINNIRSSGKSEIIQLLDLVQSDVRLTTGSNLRTIMLLASKNKIEDLKECKVELKYHEVAASEAWRVGFVKEIVKLKNEDLEVVGFSREEIEYIQEYRVRQRGCSLTHSARTPPAVHQ